MSKRIFALIAIAAITMVACFGLTGCGAEAMDEETRKSVGIGLGILIIAASGLGYVASSRHFGRKRQQAARRNAQRAKQKKRR